ncbi:thermonuclease family protein [Aliihoeflea aestuarii]|uniref:thermonuclease family protein n=1 Tax=Aliihoeflea aestuarii TaxID=453840 RepID=UPI0020935744|nr:thermonuclease family protein [Aliihoeflea aestuarii]MCO6389850.1 thermonuclease family protein [Aliihoeflea aestuarii]
MPETEFPPEETQQIEEPAAPTTPQPVPDVTAPQAPITEFERIAPREPLSSLGAPEDPATRPPRETLLHRPVVIAAGAFEAQGHRVALEGIEVVSPQEACERSGRSWPCGVYARTAFRNYLRGRSISCTVPGMPGEETVVSRCMIGNADPASWLVSQGWARAVAGGPYEEQQREALDARRGIHAAPAGN